MTDFDDSFLDLDGDQRQAAARLFGALGDLDLADAEFEFSVEVAGSPATVTHLRRLAQLSDIVTRTLAVASGGTEEALSGPGWQPVRLEQWMPGAYLNLEEVSADVERERTIMSYAIHVNPASWESSFLSRGVVSFTSGVRDDASDELELVELSVGSARASYRVKQGGSLHGHLVEKKALVKRIVDLAVTVVATEITIWGPHPPSHQPISDAPVTVTIAAPDSAIVLSGAGVSGSITTSQGVVRWQCDGDSR